MKEKLNMLEEDELFAILASHSRMIRRPLVTDGERFTVGLDEEFFRKIWIKA
jgi:arsenate reductase